MSQAVEVTLAVVSAAMIVATAVAVPVFLVRIPDDYFVRPRRKGALPLQILRAVVGMAVVVLGLAMIVLPGQGILTILVGLSILDLPIRDRLLRKILGIPRIRRGIDRLRDRAGRGRLVVA